MEAAASVAGIVTLAGALLKGVDEFVGFCKRYRGADNALDGALRELEIIHTTLQQLDHSKDDGILHTPSTHLLERQLRCFETDLAQWRQRLIAKMPPSQGRFCRFKKRFNVAINKGQLETVAKSLSSHCRTLQLIMSLLETYV